VNATAVGASIPDIAETDTTIVIEPSIERAIRWCPILRSVCQVRRPRTHTKRRFFRAHFVWFCGSFLLNGKNTKPI